MLTRCTQAGTERAVTNYRVFDLDDIIFRRAAANNRLHARAAHADARADGSMSRSREKTATWRGRRLAGGAAIATAPS